MQIGENAASNSLTDWSPSFCAIHLSRSKEMRTLTALFSPGLKIWLLTLFAFAMPSGVALAEEFVLAAADSSPTAYFVDGKPKGILVDVVTEAFRRAGHSVKIKLMPWARCLAEVQDGKVDGIFSVFKLPEREAFLAYTDVPVVVQIEAFFVHKDSDLQFDGDFSQLSKARMGVIRGTSYGAQVGGLLKNGLWPNVTVTNSVDGLASMLAAKRIDIAPTYRLVFIDAAKRIGSPQAFRELTPAVESVPSYLAFNRKRDFSKPIAAFDKALASMKKDKSFDAIYAAYLN
jgi:polar amino acid transport system substrate-binding protein